MQCPIDNETLVMADRQNIEIDYCPKCRGVWLDRGELDKLIEKSSGQQEQSMQYKQSSERHYGSEHYKYSDDDYHKKEYYKKHKKKNILGDIFDF